MASRWPPTASWCSVSAWGANEAVFIDTAADRIVGRVPVAQAHNGTISADGRSAWVGSQQQGATALVRIDVAGMKEAARVPLDKTPRALDLSPGRAPALLHRRRARRRPGARHRHRPDRGGDPGRRLTASGPARRRWARGARARPGTGRARDHRHRDQRGGGGRPGRKDASLGRVSSDGAMAYVANEARTTSPSSTSPSAGRGDDPGRQCAAQDRGAAGADPEARRGGGAGIGTARAARDHGTLDVGTERT